VESLSVIDYTHHINIAILCLRDNYADHVYMLENLKGRDYSEDLDVDGKVTLEWILRFVLDASISG
jgi:hypothetical protein